MQGAVTLCAYCALALEFLDLTGFQALVSPAAMLLPGGLLCILWAVLNKLEQQRWFYPGVLFGMLLLVLFGRAQVLEGVRLLWNQFGTVWTAGTGKALPALELQQSSHTLCCWLLAGMLSGLLAILCGLLTARAGWVLSVLLPGGLLAGALILRRDSSMLVLALIPAIAILLLLDSGWGVRKSAKAILCGAVLCGVLTGVFAAVAALPGVRSRTEAISLRVQERIHVHRYETEQTTLPEGDFTEKLSGSEAVKPALVVTMDEPEAMYLRGFTGATFADSVWQSLDNGTLAENRDLLYYLNLEAFHPTAQFAAVAADEETARNLITVQNLGACSRYQYIPFSLQDGGMLPAEELDPDGIRTDGVRTYTYAAVKDAAKLLPDTLETLQNSEEEAVLTYRKAESAYREFVNTYYLQVPPEVEELLGDAWEDAAAAYGTDLTEQEAQECVLNFLSQCFPKDGTQPDLELPLETAAGTSYQYATVAALTLRHFGIPTRYAEGYVISQEMVEAAGEDTTLSVDSSHAAAWVEIYQDGIGWLPMDLTPGFGEWSWNSRSDQVSSSTESEGAASDAGNGHGYAQTPPTVHEGLELEEEPELEEEQESPQDDTIVDLPKILWGTVLLLLALILLLILLICLRRNSKLLHWEQKFEDENCSDGVAWTFSNTVLLLEQMGFQRGNGSMQSIVEPVAAEFGLPYAAGLNVMIDINARAMFSSHPLTEAEREDALAFRTETIRLLKTATNWRKRLWIRWIQCLY